MCLNTYYAVLHHATQGIRVIWVLLPQSGGSWPDDALFLNVYDDPAWYSESGSIWASTLAFEAVPPAPVLLGSWWYFALVIPYDEDGNFFNSGAIAPLNIYPGPW